MNIEIFKDESTLYKLYPRIYSLTGLNYITSSFVGLKQDNGGVPSMLLSNS